MIRPGNPMPAHGQPRPDVDDARRRPSAAERARTLVEGNPSAVLVIPGLTTVPPDRLVPEMRSVGPEGDVFLLFPADSPAVRAATRADDDELTAVLEITD